MKSASSKVTRVDITINKWWNETKKWKIKSEMDPMDQINELNMNNEWMDPSMLIDASIHPPRYIDVDGFSSTNDTFNCSNECNLITTHQ